MPIAFWIFSIGGGLLLLVYALYRNATRCSSSARRSAYSSICATFILDLREQRRQGRATRK